MGGVCLWMQKTTRTSSEFEHPRHLIPWKQLMGIFKTFWTGSQPFMAVFSFNTLLAICSTILNCHTANQNQSILIQTRQQCFSCYTQCFSALNVPGKDPEPVALSLWATLANVSSTTRYTALAAVNDFGKDWSSSSHNSSPLVQLWSMGHFVCPPCIGSLYFTMWLLARLFKNGIPRRSCGPNGDSILINIVK